jgi:hypothetical protein
MTKVLDDPPFSPSPLAGKVAEGRMGTRRGADYEDHDGSPPALRATSPLRGEEGVSS